MYDVVINGGAMAGVTLALALNNLSQGNMRIALIEKQPLNQHQQCGFDARCIALSQGSCQRLNTISGINKQSLWQQIQPLSTPIKLIHVSDRGHLGLTEFVATEFGLEQLGAVIELCEMGRVLLNNLAKLDNIDYICPAEIQQIEQRETQLNIQLKDNRTLNTKLLIGADGMPSTVAQFAGIPQQLVTDYQQTAIICNIQPQQFHHYRAFERFTEEGPIALLPMSEGLMTLVWCVKYPESLLALNDNQFLHQLQQRFGWRLGKLQQCGKRFAYPLKLFKAMQHIQPRIALIGNAAQSLHPIAGQGFNLAMRDVLSLAKTLSIAFKQGQDIGDYAVLQNYRQQRQPDQAKIIGLTDGLVSLFANDILPLQIGRNLGLMALAQSQWLRQAFAKPTLGWN